IPVDTPYLGPILENIKFPNRKSRSATLPFGSRRTTPMPEQNDNQLIEREISSEMGAAATHSDAADAPAAGTEAVLRTRLSEGAEAARGGVVSEGRGVTAQRLRRLLIVGASLLALAGGSYFGWQYWTVGRFQVSTDDAYVKADNTTIAPKVSGYLGEVLVADNEPVKTGQVLARIDDRDYVVAVEQATADVAAAKAAANTKQASLAAQQSIIDSARASLDVDQANLTCAQQEDKRYAYLATTSAGSVQNAQQAASRLAAARASVTRDTAALETATRQVDVLKAEFAQAQAALARSLALQKQAELNLSYTAI